jgi:hypothetical protein
MEQIQKTFATCKEEKRAALVAYFTSGYPTPDETVEIMLGLQAGGAGESAHRFLRDLFLPPRKMINPLLTLYQLHRRNRAWPTFHRPNCRRTYGPDCKYTSS